MKIKGIKLGILRAPLLTPFKTSLRTVTEIEDLVVKIYTDCGIVGWGEGAPTAKITGETLGSMVEAISKVIAPALVGKSLDQLDEVFDILDHAIVGNTTAKAAVDMALYDCFTQKLGIPLYKFLGGYKESFETDITISLNPVEEMVSDSLKAVEKGYSILKVKVGNHPKEDLLRLRRIREAVGEEVVIRVDANQGWKKKEALEIMKDLETWENPPELIEQPLVYSHISGMKYLTEKSRVPILADESVFSPKDALYILETNSADYINIKLMKTGGIHQALKIITLAQLYDVPCMMGCMLESKISVTAAAHLAMAKKTIAFADLDGPGLCKEDPVLGGMMITGGKVTLPQNPGLGIKGILPGYYKELE